jgi:hypothetical protein
MDAAAVDKLIEKASFPPEVAVAVAEAVEVTIKAENIVTVPVLDTRFAAVETKMEARFGAVDGRFAAADAKMEARFGAVEAKVEARFGKIEARFAELGAEMAARFGAVEKAIVATKLWAAYIYAGLAIALFGALATDHRWLEGRQDEYMARSDARFAAMQAQSDQRFQQVEARLDSLDVRMEQMSEQIRVILARTDGGQAVNPSLPPSRPRSH